MDDAVNGQSPALLALKSSERHEIRIVEGRRHPAGSMEKLDLRDVLLNWSIVVVVNTIFADQQDILCLTRRYDPNPTGGGLFVALFSVGVNNSLGTLQKIRGR